MPKSEPLSSVDAAWLHMDKPANLAMITGVIMFDGPIDLERLRATYAYRLLPAYPRFRQRVHEPPLGLGRPRWEPDQAFDLTYHVNRVALPAPGDDAALKRLVGQMISLPLDRARPLWQITLAEPYGQGCALVCRLHHCLADGLALVLVMLSLADTEPDAPWPEPPAPAARRPRPLLARLVTQAADAAEQALSTAEHWFQDSLETFLRPADRLAVGGAYALALSKLTLLGPDRKTVFRGQCAVPKQTAWSRPLALTDVKTVAHAFDATINDVLLAAVVGGLRRYIERRAGSVDGLDIRAMVPFSLRRPEEFNKLGNRFGLVLLSLPVGVRDPLQRIHMLKQRMDEIKSSPEALVAFAILGAMGLTPIQVEELILKFFAAKATAVMTNVPGPREPLYLAGQLIRGVMFWAPHPGNLGLGVSIISYNGAVAVGIVTDKGLAPNPDEIVAGFQAEYATMRKAIQPKRRPARQPRAAGLCRAKSRSGQPCRNRALAGGRYCRVHQRS